MKKKEINYKGWWRFTKVKNRARAPLVAPLHSVRKFVCKWPVRPCGCWFALIMLVGLQRGKKTALDARPAVPPMRKSVKKLARRWVALLAFKFSWVGSMWNNLQSAVSSLSMHLPAKCHKINKGSLCHVSCSNFNPIMRRLGKAYYWFDHQWEVRRWTKLNKNCECWSQETDSAYN